MVNVSKIEATSLLKKLVSIASVNPNIEGKADEIELAHFVAEYFERLGIEVHTQDVVDGRFNVIARVKGSNNGKRLMFNGHLDTVGVRNMTVDPFKAFTERGRLHGRGACDMKGSIAAMMIAMKILAQSGSSLRGDVLASFVVGEEFDNTGTKKLINDPNYAKIADAVIVGEPTTLKIAVAHKGYALIECEIKGKAAHGSVPEKGIDAIEKMAKLVAKISQLENKYERQRNGLLGPTKIHTSIIQGGREWSVIPDQCTLKLEARTIPGHGSKQVVQDMRNIITKLSAEDSQFNGSVRLVDSGEPLRTSQKESLVRTLQATFRELYGTKAKVVGMPYYSEASLFSNILRIPSCVIGAGDIKLAHTADEFIKISEVVEATRIYVTAAELYVNKK